jgi:hypothetical protein
MLNFIAVLPDEESRMNDGIRERCDSGHMQDQGIVIGRGEASIAPLKREWWMGRCAAKQMVCCQRSVGMCRTVLAAPCFLLDKGRG